MSTRWQSKRDTAANWTSNNPILLSGEWGYETDTGKIKIGDGSTAWNSISYSVVTNHSILDGSVHTDSVADGVTRGSIIYGNATPKWDELPIGGAGTVLSSDGTDVSWGAAGGTGFGRPLVFTPQMNEPPTSNFATLDTRNNHPVLDFDATTNESAVFRGVLPTGYAGGGLTVYIHYAMTSAEVNTVDWDVAFERIGDQQLDIDGDSFADVKSVDNTTVPGTTGLVDVVSVAFTDGADMDSIAAGENFRVKVTRDAASDDAAGDAEILFLVIKET